ncbi:MAG: hypothetical protein ACI3ZC_07700 [Candidatus Cryptobacteroides sp.]
MLKPSRQAVYRGGKQFLPESPVAVLLPGPAGILDIACGTGDFSIAIAREMLRVLRPGGRKAFMQTLRDCGFTNVTHKAFTLGICRMLDIQLQ